MKEKKSTLFSESQPDALSNQDIRLAYERLLSAYKELQAKNNELESAAGYNLSILEAMEESLIVLDHAFRIRTANRSFFGQYALAPNDEEGNSFLNIGGGLFDTPEVKGFLKKAFSGDARDADLETTINPAGAGERIVLLHVAPIESGFVSDARVLVTIKDLTERRILERKKDEFISIASHELKTPATSIQAYTQILYYEFLAENDHRSAGLISKLNGQVGRLTRLTKDLLDVTKINEGQLRLKAGYFDMNILIDEVVEQMQLTTFQRIIVKQKNKQDSSCVWGDRDRLEQVLVNLIANAIKYSPESEPVILSSEVREDELRVSVQDFGIGIPADKRNRVFDRFFRSDDASTLKHPGLGLGLYISYEIVRKHGGKITLESENGKGTVFTVVLPLKKLEG